MRTLANNHRTRVALELPQGLPPDSRLHMVFNVHRMASVRNAAIPPGWLRDSSRHANVISLRAVAPLGGESLDVISRGGPLELAKLVLIERPGAHRAFVRRVNSDGTASEWTAVPSNDAQTALFGAQEYLRLLHRELHVSLPECALTEYRRFFFELDRHTEAILLAHNPFPTPTAEEKARVLHALPFVRRALSMRMGARMREHLENPFRSTPFADAASFGSYVNVISTVFLRLLGQCFRGSRGELDLGAFEEAFEMFATGELRYWLPELNVWTTQPSSGNFFLFGEFALLAAECGIETELWTRLAGVMIRAQALYCASYPAEEVHPSLGDFTPRYAPDRRPTHRERSRLRAAHAGLDLPGLSGAAMQNLWELARGEFRLRADETRIGDLLVDMEAMTSSQRDLVLVPNGHVATRFGDRAVEMGFVTRPDVEEALRQQGAVR